ncbi:glycoside hydrolase family 44 protein [Bordetella sp. FB-8]|uniref:glycoside hydrolase family 44 protein n=1 Tax=Bordetella sp. FB-8 TaxID=1159870 RepID=UPI000372F35D|nr:glycoside hydrolase family 44 protein [Bordetella sp. FB-8]
MPKLRRLSLRILLAMLLWSGATAGVACAQNTPLPVTIVVNAGANRHPISPLIYGLNFGTTETLKDLRVTINRSGGNSASTYNWKIDARNAGVDWFFESQAVDPKAIYDQFNERFVELTRAGGAVPMLTIPMIGRVAKLGKDRARLASFSIAKYGPQQNFDVNGLIDAGNGVGLDGKFIKNDPDDASVPDDPQSQEDRVKQLVRKFGHAGGARYYLMDNEPSLWQLAHRDIHPIGAHAREIASKVIAYSKAVKAADPKALIVAPEEWGWMGFHYSGFDTQYMHDQKSMAYAPDRQTETQGMDYVPWLLTQWKKAGHPIDVFSLHFYPQGGEYNDAGEPNTPAIALARNRSTRDLWDPNYKDPNWINSVVDLIPTMRKWVDTYYYPGTPIALTEYNWGGENLMNGATAQADLLGIFGREGLDIATRWGTIDPSMPVYKAIKLYRNYDGHGSAFGTTSVADTAPDPDQVSSFAALRDHDHVMTIMVINKQLDQSADTTIAVDNFPGKGKAETWQLADNAIARLQDTDYANSQLHTMLPPQSVTLFVLHDTAHK